MGGLPKKASRIEQSRRESRLPVLLLDGGSLLFRPGHYDPGQTAQAGIVATALVDSYNLMAYDAVGVSSRDLAGGVAFLLELQARAKFAWLSANLLDARSGRPLFRPYLELPLGNIRLAVTALTDQAPQLVNKIGADCKLVGWAEILPRLIAELEKRNDFIILLTGYDQATCREIAAAFPQINLIIPAFGVDNLPPELLSDTTILTQTGRQGEYLGALTVHPQPSRRWDNGMKEALAQKRREMAILNRQEERFRNRPQAQGRYRQILKKTEKLGKQIKGLEKELQQRPAGEAESTYTSRFLAISPNLPDDPKVLAIIDQAKRRVAESTGDKPGSPAKHGG